VLTNMYSVLFTDNGGKEKWHRRMVKWLQHMILKVLKVCGYTQIIRVDMLLGLQDSGSL
jgi:hypothetical protein